MASINKKIKFKLIKADQNQESPKNDNIGNI
jgi:hypothetical protein